MGYKDVLAPRQDGSIARLRVYDAQPRPLIVDADRAYAAIEALGKYNASYVWSTRLFTALGSLALVGGFVALLWWPWWTPLVGLFVGINVLRATKQSAADFVRDIVRESPAGAAEMTRLGLIVDRLPDAAVEK